MTQTDRKKFIEIAIPPSACRLGLPAHGFNRLTIMEQFGLRCRLSQATRSVQEVDKETWLGPIVDEAAKKVSH